jgi:hypothetical protein
MLPALNLRTARRSSSHVLREGGFADAALKEYLPYTNDQLSVLKAKDAEIAREERIRFQVDESFKLLFVGGSPAADESRREMFGRCKVATAGNHSGADLSGDWEEDAFWERITSWQPTCIVLDRGSDSWLSSRSKSKLMDVVEELGCIFMFSPWPRMGEGEPNVMYTSNPLRYNATVFNTQEVLFTFWADLEERDAYPSAVLKQITTEWAAISGMSAEECAINYDSRNAFSTCDNLNPKSQTFDEAVRSQISMFSGCADP